MIKRFLLIGVFLLGLVLPYRVQAQADIGDDLLACWDLDETTGVRFDHLNALNLTDNNTVGSNVGNTNAVAADFVPGNSEYLSHLDDPGLAPSGDFYTVVGWFYPDAAGAGSRRGLVSKYGASGQRSWFTKMETNDRFSVGVSGDGSTATVLELTGGLPQHDAWNWFAVEHDGAADVLTATHKTATTTRIQSTAHSTGIFTGSNTFHIGKTIDSSDRFHDGRIGPVAIWDRLLTAGELTWLYNSHQGRSCNAILPVAGVSADSAFYLLPSGDTGALEKSLTVGEAAIASGIALLVGLGVLGFVRDTADRVGGR